MRRLSGFELRQALLDGERLLAEERASRSSGPRDSEVNAARMLVDAFGHRTASPPPYMEQLHGEFVRAQDHQVRLASALERCPPRVGEPPRSPRRFAMRRDWDPGE